MAEYRRRYARTTAEASDRGTWRAYVPASGRAPPAACLAGSSAINGAASRASQSADTGSASCTSNTTSGALHASTPTLRVVPWLNSLSRISISRSAPTSQQLDGAVAGAGVDRDDLEWERSPSATGSPTGRAATSRRHCGSAAGRRPKACPSPDRFITCMRRFDVAASTGAEAASTSANERFVTPLPGARVFRNRLDGWRAAAIWASQSGLSMRPRGTAASAAGDAAS